MKIIATGIAILLSGTSLAFAAGFEILKPHRAVYDVKLENAEERSGIKGMNGRIVYEVLGNECEGISVQYRFVTRINTGRDTIVTDQRTSTHESPDGREFSFRTQSFVNDQKDQNIVGNAERRNNAVEVKLGQGEKQELELEDAIFSTSHLVKIMQQASEGKTFISDDIFDGSGDGDKVLRSASVIGKPKVFENRLEDEDGEAIQKLVKEEAWPVTMSYFDKGLGNSGESMPIYEASFYLYGDGVTRQLTMKYPDYSLLASLQELEYYDPSPCKLEN